MVSLIWFPPQFFAAEGLNPNGTATSNHMTSEQPSDQSDREFHMCVVCGGGEEEEGVKL